ncbi:unnamed protein product, partial [Owenia fusiformis]
MSLIQNTTSSRMPFLNDTLSSQNQTQDSRHFEAGNESTSTVFVNNLTVTEVNQNHESLVFEPLVVFMITLNCFLSLLICGSNLPVLVSILSFKTLRTANNMFLLSLAIADICIWVVVLPLNIINRYMTPFIFEGVMQNENICIAKCFFNVCLSGASLFSMGGIALDRYVAVTRPLKYKVLVTRTRTLWFITLGWFYSIVVGSSFMFFRRGAHFDEYNVECVKQVFTRGYMIFVNANIFVLFVIILVSHIVVAVVAVQQRSKCIQRLTRVNNTLAVNYLKESRLVKTITLVVVLFALC